MRKRSPSVRIRAKKRLLIIFFMTAVLLSGLLFRVAWIQIVRGDEYTDIAKEQQIRDIPVEPRRGSIYDRNGKELATSATTYSVWVRPAQLKEAYKADERDALASQLAVTLGMDAEAVKKDFSSKTALIKVAKYLELEQADKVRELGIAGLEIAEDNKRFYPLGTFAASVLGSVNDDGVGRSGIELCYDRYLTGVSGRYVTDADVNGNTLPSGKGLHYEPDNGLDIHLTIDEYLQQVMDAAVKTGYEKTESECVIGIAMDPKTGEIFANSEYPTFDPNSPFEPSNLIARDAENYKKMDEESQTAYLQTLWKNRTVSDLYEPGSTFKLVTAASAMEEGTSRPEKTYYCQSYYEIDGYKIYNFNHMPHGTESLEQAIGNSCNPVLMQVALELGKEKFYNYIDLFGFTSRTGVDLPGEADSIVKNKEDIVTLDFAELSFGQGIAVTPMQLLTAISAFGNDGVMMKPHYVSSLTDKDGKTKIVYKPTVVRHAVSAETAKSIRSFMYNNVENYYGKEAQVAGYKIGGKTGTANRAVNGVYSDAVDCSFVTLAPIDDPQIAVLILCRSPKYGVAYLSTYPITIDFYNNALPYLNVPREKEEGQTEVAQDAVAFAPDVTGKDYKAAQETLKEHEIAYEILPALTENEKKDKNFTFSIADQYPKAGEKMIAGQKLYLYRE